MPSLPTNIYSVASAREIDRLAIEEQGVAGYMLMQRAGAAAVRDARSRFPDAKRWQVICGSGNNAGDGYVIARLAAQDGIVVSAVSLVDPTTLTGDAASAYGDFAAEGGVVMTWDGQLDAEAELLVDAILGNGLQRDVGGDFAQAIAAINAHPAAVHAIDIASGINGDSGAVMGTAVTAELTTTFVGLKPGLFLADGPAHCGEVRFSGLEIPELCYANQAPVFQRLGDSQLSSLLRPRSRGAHKGDFGHVLVVGGGPGMPGAARLAAEAALRVGAGRVSLATHPDHAAYISATRPELMSHALASPDQLQELLASTSVVAFGPGLGQSDWAKSLFQVLSDSQTDAVWDADALNLLSKDAKSVENRVITPHPGEAATLLVTSTDAIQGDRPAAVRQLAERYGGIAVLKGAGTLISRGEEVPIVCTSGNPGMAAPGMGDALTGIIAGLIAQGLSLHDAAAAGVEVHARAGDCAALGGERGMTASDVIGALRRVVNP